MFAIRARRKVATEKDFLEAINKVICPFTLNYSFSGNQRLCKVQRHSKISDAQLNGFQYWSLLYVLV